MDALVTGVEVNDSHGVGVFLRRLFPANESFVVFRSRTLYGGANNFGGREVLIGDRFGSVDDLRRRLRAEAGGVERILCVPYFPEDFRVAALLKEVTGARLCTYVMDDQNVVTPEVGDAVVRRLVAASDLCLGISAPMCEAYGAKFGRKFWWLPPVVERVRNEKRCQKYGLTPRRVALLGNFWSRRQLEDFRETVRGSGWTVEWFGKGVEAAWLGCDGGALEEDGIFVRGFLPDSELRERLADFAFAVVPSGRMDAGDDKRSFAALSFPSRMIYLFTQAGLPVLLVGNPESAAGKFLVETGSGLVCGYDREEFVAAAERLVGEADSFRTAVAGVAETMVLPDGGGWIWRSLAEGRAVDDRFERMIGGARWTGETVTRAVAASTRWWTFDPERWRYSRKAQLAWIRRRTSLEATGPHSFSVGGYQRALAAALIRKLLRKGKRVGLLGGELSDLRPVSHDFVVECEMPNAEFEMGFDAVVSFDREAVLTRAELEAMGRRGALQLHFWTAYLHPQHFEVAAAGRMLLGESEDTEELMERMMNDEGFLFMSPRAIERFWPGARAEEIGRPFSLNLIWRGEGPANDAKGAKR